MPLAEPLGSMEPWLKNTAVLYYCYCCLSVRLCVCPSDCLRPEYCG